MGSIKKWNRFSRDVLTGKAYPENALCYELQRFTKVFYVWYNVEDFKRLSVRDKAIHLSLIFLTAMNWFLIGVNISTIPVNLENTAAICKPGSFAIGGFQSVLRFIQCWRHREKLTQILKIINQKVQVARRVATEERLKENLKLHIHMAWATITGIILLTAMYIMRLIYTIWTADYEFKMALPFEVVPYSASWWIEVAVNQVVLWFCAFLYTIFEGLFMDAVIQLAFLHRVQYDRLRNLSSSRAPVKGTLISIYRELEELKLLTRDYLNIVWLLQFSFWSVGFLILATGAVGIAVEIEEGFSVLLNFVTYPMFIVGLMGIASFTGTYFEEANIPNGFKDLHQVGGLNAELFNSDWIELPQGNRKMVIILMTFGQITPRLEVEPFFVINREYFAEVLKKTYTFYAVIRTFIGDN